MTQVVVALLLGGLMGLIGQATRAVIGVKKLSDQAADSNLTVSDLFSAVRFGMSLVIGFVAGMIGALTIGLDKIEAVNAANIDLLLGLAAIGYAGTDAIEAFAVRVSGVQPSPASGPTQQNGLPKPDSVILATHLVGSQRAVLSADDIIGRINDAGRSPPPAPVPAPITTDPTVGRAAVADHAPANAQGYRRELAEAMKYKAAIQEASQSCGVDPFIICGIGSRESAWGLTLRPPGPSGTGDFAPRDPGRWGYRLPPDGLGWGRGLMQIDYQQEFAKTGDWRDPTANILHGSMEVADNIEFFRNFEVTGIDPVNAGIAAYNCGRGNVVKALRAGLDVDRYTTGHDYSADVLKRADWFRAQGFGQGADV